MVFLSNPLSRLILISFLLLGCGKTENEKKIKCCDNLWIGNATRDSVSFYGYDNVSYNNKEIRVTIQPYDSGFSVDLEPLSSGGHYVCTNQFGTGDHKVRQGGEEEKFYLDEEPPGKNDIVFSEGYIESGTLDSCGIITKDTRWIVLGSRLEKIDMEKAYDVTIYPLVNQSGNQFYVTVRK
tara:strand:+ start:56 stop:598 length:543 start_codon:yes stop_codon:yes gene_type:complete